VGRAARDEFASEEARRRHEPTWIRSLLHTAFRSGLVGREDFAELATERLAELEPDEIAPEAEVLLVEILGVLWDGGWQPEELHREVRRSQGAAAARLVLDAIGADHRENGPTPLDPRWDAQLAELQVDRAIEPGWVRRWYRSESLGDGPAFVAELVGALRHLIRLPSIEVLVPPRGAAGPSASAPLADPHDPVLIRVRALLAQAESTSFEAEAEAFTAKAHALMARHAIDAARVAAAAGDDERPVTVRLPVDEPYVEAKSLLLHVVADQGRCRAVYYPRLAMSSVVGFPSDVASVELLFTSLLVQAQSAMVNAAKTAPPGAQTRSRRFRSSFLRAYAMRIGERLEEINATVLSEAEAEAGMALVPVLEERAHVVDEAFEALFPDIRQRASGSTFDAAGWASGERAADQAKLNPAELSA
jgi:hypothetical protein